MAENVSLQVGGTSGIGLSTVKLFLKRGVSVVVADIDEGRGTAVERDLTSRGYAVTFVKASVTDDDSLNNMIAKAASIYGKIDFAVNTAGVTGPQVEGHLLKDPDWYKVISTDLEGTWRFSKAIITYFRSQEPRLVRHDVGPYWGPVFQRGSLVNIASSLGSEGKAYLAVYCKFTSLTYKRIMICFLTGESSNQAPQSMASLGYRRHWPLRMLSGESE